MGTKELKKTVAAASVKAKKSTVTGSEENAKAEKLSAFFLKMPIADQRIALIATSIYAGGVISADDAHGVYEHIKDYWESAFENILTAYGMK